MTDLLTEYWDLFLFDTLVWTGALIALVMLVRRPVARVFGAGAAYALWFLPLARFVMPPFTLPAWMRPVEASVPPSEPVLTLVSDTAYAPLAEPGVMEPSVFAASEPVVDLLTPLLVIWLCGALVMLARRFQQYFELRRELLAEARPVGEVGAIRLIETPAISGPMAFGVIDRVIALPMGFMASRNRTQRDLAIEHELAHHRGGDLLVNMAVQPLFAIHWFNPLGWLGWRALRRDQEAFCDARVVASRTHEERADYARVIADFARRPALAPRPALAAPMACPVLGDKSIIHRLRSLSMSDISPRRRLAGRAALVAAFLAVPMTASIAYADTLGSDVEEPPAPPAPPSAPGAPPLPPAPPAPPEVEIDIEMAEMDRELAEVDRELAEAHREIVEIERELSEDGKRRETRRVVRIDDGSWQEMSDEERAELRRNMAELRKQFGEDGEMRRQIRLSVAEAQRAGAEARANAPRVEMKCVDRVNIVKTDTDAKGKTVMFVCEANADRMALGALKTARSAIESERNLTDEQRAEALRAIDEEISSLNKAG